MVFLLNIWNAPKPKQIDLGSWNNHRIMHYQVNIYSDVKLRACKYVDFEKKDKLVWVWFVTNWAACLVLKQTQRYQKKIPHTGDTESLNRCGEKQKTFFCTILFVWRRPKLFFWDRVNFFFIFIFFCGKFVFVFERVLRGANSVEINHWVILFCTLVLSKKFRKKLIVSMYH